MFTKKICILTSVHRPFDVRIFHKEAKTLVNAGYNVVLIVSHNKTEIVNGVKIIPLPEPKNRFERITKVVWKLFRLALKEKADVYHFHDPELIPIGIILKFLNKKVIYDVHEDVPEQILTKDYWFKSLFVRKLISKIVHLFEQFGVFMFDGIIAATPEIAKKFNQEKTMTIKNLPIISLIDKVQPIKIDKKKPIVIYVGGLSKIRGIKEIIQAMEFVEGKAELWLLGKWESEKFKKECENLEGWKYTKYLGFVPYGKHYSFIKTADIGIINFYPLPNQENALPNKPFEYMACLLPMVMSNFPYWQEIFGECALFADPYNPKDIAEKVRYLLDHYEKLKILGNKGRQLIEEKYSWEAEQSKLLDVYKKILNK